MCSYFYDHFTVVFNALSFYKWRQVCLGNTAASVGVVHHIWMWSIVCTALSHKANIKRSSKASTEKVSITHSHRVHVVIKLIITSGFSIYFRYSINSYIFSFIFLLYYPPHQSRNRFNVTSSLAKPQPHGVRCRPTCSARVVRRRRVHFTLRFFTTLPKPVATRSMWLQPK